MAKKASEVWKIIMPLVLLLVLLTFLFICLYFGSLSLIIAADCVSATISIILLWILVKHRPDGRRMKTRIMVAVLPGTFLISSVGFSESFIFGFIYIASVDTFLIVLYLTWLYLGRIAHSSNALGSKRLIQWLRGKLDVFAIFVFLLVPLVLALVLIDPDNTLVYSITIVAAVVIFGVLSCVLVDQIFGNIRTLIRNQKWKMSAAALAVVVIALITWRIWGLELFFKLVDYTDIAQIVVYLTCLIFPPARGIDQEESEEDEEADITGLLVRYRYEVLKAATDNFQTSIGKGGSGSVYRGTLGTNGSQCIAVKRIHEAQGRKEFKNEVEALARIQHFNLVRLLGYCLGPTGFRCIVYEFIPNGSLATWIFTENNTIDKWLTWTIRYQIAIDVACGLAYLHHDCHFKILHRDVKPDNILLDKEFRARVSDFGLSRLLGRDEEDVRTTVKGTVGYLAPEWNLPNGVSEKSDVYSYGVVLLELVAGQRNMRVIDDDSDVPKWDFRFPKEAFEKMRDGKVMDMVARRLAEDEDFKEEELKVLVGAGLLCMQTKPEHRPSMADVVDMLEKRVPVDVPPENRVNITNFSENVSESTSSTEEASVL